MSYRGGGGGITGTNNIPLGNRRRFGGDGGSESPAPAPAQQEPREREREREREYSPRDPGNGLVDLKRGRSPVRGWSLIFFLFSCILFFCQVCCRY